MVIIADKLLQPRQVFYKNQSDPEGQRNYVLPEKYSKSGLIKLFVWRK